MSKTAAQPILSFENIDVKQFTYGPPHSKNGTITNIAMNYNRSRVKIQSPLMFCPFGISVLRDKKEKDNIEKAAFSIELQLGSDDAKLDAFTKWCSSLDEKVINDVRANSNAWLKKSTLNETLAKQLHNPCVKKYYDKELCKTTDKYPARIRFKLGRKNEKFVTRIFNQDRQAVDLDSMSLDEIEKLGKSNRMRVIFEIGGVWGGAKGFGVTLRAAQIMLFPPQKLTGFGFVHDIEDDLIFGDAVDNSVAPPSVVEAAAPNENAPAAVEPAVITSSNIAPTTEVAATEVNSDEDEGTEELQNDEAAAPEPEPEAPKPKGKAPKKATESAKGVPKQVTLTKFSKKK